MNELFGSRPTFQHLNVKDLMDNSNNVYKWPSLVTIQDPIELNKKNWKTKKYDEVIKPNNLKVTQLEKLICT
jgi:hypothetical protein